MDGVRRARVCILISVRRLAATINWYSSCYVSVEFLADDTLGTDEDCIGLEVGVLDDAQ